MEQNNYGTIRIQKLVNEFNNINIDAKINIDPGFVSGGKVKDLELIYEGVKYNYIPFKPLTDEK